MSVEGAAHQVAVAVDQVADPDEVVIDVTEVALVIGRHPGDGVAGHQRGEHVALGGDHLAQGDERAFHVEQLPELSFRGGLEDCVFQLVDLVVKGGQDGEVAVDQHVHHSVKDHDVAGLWGDAHL
jgi:cation transport ATPase